MSHSVPSDSSTADSSFLVGADLVQFDRQDLAIYLTPETRADGHWAAAGHDAVAYGVPLDRLFGEPGEVFVSMSAAIDEATIAALAVLDDPMVVLSGLADGLILPASEPVAATDLADPAPAPETATIYDFGAEALPIHDAWAWDLSKPDWTFDQA
jgi:hypothetical protein